MMNKNEMIMNYKNTLELLNKNDVFSRIVKKDLEQTLDLLALGFELNYHEDIKNYL